VKIWFWTLGIHLQKKATCRIVVHSKANRSEQAVTHELSKVLSIVIVFIAKNNRLRCRKRKRRQKVEESQKMEEKIDKKRIGRETQRIIREKAS
jgi:hypothetical protein